MSNWKGIAIFVALAGAVTFYALVIQGVGSGDVGGPLAPVGKEFGKDMQAGDYAAACALTTPETVAAIKAAGGCPQALPKAVDAELAKRMAEDDFSCSDEHGDIGYLRGTGGPVEGKYCDTEDALVVFHNVDGKWLVSLSDELPTVSVTPPRGSAATTTIPGTDGKSGQDIASCAVAAGGDAAKIQACVGQ